MLKLLFFCLLLMQFSLVAQDSKNYLFMEVGGTGVTGSANYAFLVNSRYRYKVIFQMGMGWTPKVALSTNSFNMPFQLTCNFGRQGFFFESGVGATVIFKSKLGKAETQNATGEFYLSPVVGVRHESEHWFARLYACPLIHVTGERRYDKITRRSPGFGLGIGARF